MNATTQVLTSQEIDLNPIAYFASISQVIADNNGKADLEVLAYCYSALLSMVSIAVI
jgi:hypothetical protein